VSDVAPIVQNNNTASNKNNEAITITCDNQDDSKVQPSAATTLDAARIVTDANSIINL